MITLDPLEQVPPQPFELIGADTRGYGFPRLIKIKTDFVSAERPHRHPCNRDGLKCDLAVNRNSNGRVQLMRLTRQRPQLLGRGRAAIGLVEKPLTSSPRLVGANDIMSGISHRYPGRLFPRQQLRDLTRPRKF
jgi:hypothetical protein